MGPKPMALRFEPLSEEDASAIVGWRYEGPYAVYNARPEDKPALLNPKYSYHSVRNEQGELIGFCCFGLDARVAGGNYEDAEGETLDVGLGLRPDLTGRGMGLGFTSAVLEFAKERFSALEFRLTVAAFNLRAFRVYERAGFQEVGRFRSERDGRQFVQMTRAA